LALPVVVMGCGTFVTTTQLNPPPHPLVYRAAASVEVYSSSPPTQPHVDLALLELEQNGGLGRAALIELLRERAGALGCDAVFIGGVRGRGFNGEGFDSPREMVNATCLVYTAQRDVPLVLTVPPAPVLTVAPVPHPGERRMCHDRQDFQANRDCVLGRVSN
jgi:hypothetical protein